MTLKSYAMMAHSFKENNTSVKYNFTNALCYWNFMHVVISCLFSILKYNTCYSTNPHACLVSLVTIESISFMQCFGFVIAYMCL